MAFWLIWKILQQYILIPPLGPFSLKNDELPLNSLFWSPPTAAHRFDSADMAGPGLYIAWSLLTPLRGFKMADIFHRAKRSWVISFLFCLAGLTLPYEPLILVLTVFQTWLLFSNNRQSNSWLQAGFGCTHHDPLVKVNSTKSLTAST